MNMHSYCNTVPAFLYMHSYCIAAPAVLYTHSYCNTVPEVLYMHSYCNALQAVLYMHTTLLLNVLLAMTVKHYYCWGKNAFNDNSVKKTPFSVLCVTLYTD